MAEPAMVNGASPPPPAAVMDPNLADQNLTPDVLQNVLAFLRRNGLTETEELLSREANNRLKTNDGGCPTHDALMSEFELLVQHVEGSYDFFQAEYSLLLFPIFAHCFLKLLSDTNNPRFAKDFFTRFQSRVPSAYSEQVDEMGRMQNMHQANASMFIQLLTKNPYTVKMSRSCIQPLELFLGRIPIIKGIIKDRIIIEQSDVLSKLKSSVECQMGGLLGQISKNHHRHKMMYGVIRDELCQAIEKRRAKGKDQGSKDFKKSSANAPLPERIPLPPLSEAYRKEKRRAIQDAAKLTLVSQDQPPSICMFTALNAHGGVTSSDVSDDTSLLALGYGNSTINLFAFDDTNKLKVMRSMDELERIDTDVDNVDELLYDNLTASSHSSLKGHGGPVYSVNFSTDKRLVVSSARDNTIRLWSTDTQKNVVVYRLSMPAWQVRFCERGYYFCSGGADKSAILWCTDRMAPLRIFPDSFGQVSAVDFHPNSNYIVGGSDDRYIRIWDVLSGSCVRTFSGHKAAVRGVKFSPCGRYVASVGADGTTCVWDVAYNRLAGAETRSINGTMGAISFSRDGGTFAASYGGSNVSIYSLDNLISASSNQNEQSFDPKINSPGFNTFSYPTKQTPVMGLHFTRRNLLIAVGSYNQ